MGLPIKFKLDGLGLKGSKYKTKMNYDAAYEANKGWMHNLDKLDNKKHKADGWVRADILYTHFPGLSKEVKGVTTKYENGSIFFNADQMAEYITYNK